MQLKQIYNRSPTPPITELLMLNEDLLTDQAEIFKNTSLLNDWKPTKEFLTMGQRKGGYCNQTKLRVDTIDDKTKKKV